MAGKITYLIAPGRNIAPAPVNDANRLAACDTNKKLFTAITVKLTIT